MSLFGCDIAFDDCYSHSGWEVEWLKLWELAAMRLLLDEGDMFDLLENAIVESLSEWPALHNRNREVYNVMCGSEELACTAYFAGMHRNWPDLIRQFLNCRIAQASWTPMKVAIGQTSISRSIWSFSNIWWTQALCGWAFSRSWRVWFET